MTWKLAKSVMEVRYEKGYQYIDRTGAIASDLVRLVPGLELETANVERTVMRSNLHGIDLAYGMKSTFVAAEFEYCGKFNIGEQLNGIFDSVLRSVGVGSLSRIGNRITYHLEFPNNPDAAHAHLETLGAHLGVVRAKWQPSGAKLFEESRAKEFYVRYENSSYGCNLRLRLAEVVLKITAHEILLGKLNVPKPVPIVEFDVDLFTVSSVPTTKFLAAEFFDSNVKLIDRMFLQTFPPA